MLITVKAFIDGFTSEVNCCEFFLTAVNFKNMNNYLLSP